METKKLKRFLRECEVFYLIIFVMGVYALSYSKGLPQLLKSFADWICENAWYSKWRQYSAEAIASSLEEIPSSRSKFPGCRARSSRFRRARSASGWMMSVWQETDCEVVTGKRIFRLNSSQKGWNIRFIN